MYICVYVSGLLPYLKNSKCFYLFWITLNNIDGTFKCVSMNIPTTNVCIERHWADIISECFCAFLKKCAIRARYQNVHSYACALVLKSKGRASLNFFFHFLNFLSLPSLFFSCLLNIIQFLIDFAIGNFLICWI